MERSRAALEWEGQGEQRILLRQMRTKFGHPLAVDLETRLPSLSSEERDRWAVAIVSAPTLEAFRVLVGLPAQ